MRIENEEPADAKSAASIIERLCEVSGCVTDAELARRFKIAPSSISKWRSRDAVPVAQIRRITALSNANLQYVLTGTRKGTEFREIYTIDSTVLSAILRALNVRELLRELRESTDAQIAQALARRISQAYSGIETLAQDLSKAHGIPLEQARAVATSSFLTVHRAIHDE